MFNRDLSEDIKSTTMGESGADIQFTGEARKIFPWAVECKSRKSFKTIYDMYYQSDSCEGENVLVIKQDRDKPLAVVDAELFITIMTSMGINKW